MECSEEFIQLVYDEKHHQVTMISCCNENEQNFWKKKKKCHLIEFKGGNYCRVIGITFTV